ncbi:hypothetical protein [Mycobacteroides saopaulense]|uniref:hypothetical protein n=1 Tax=Mycobacteroides saopaulense TaxID=1578165 RepID=UPI0012FFA530|nr:hypothetical protein [Mycobacteroides saopaulense]
MSATYDALMLISGITSNTTVQSGGVDGATEQEVHALAYLAGQLSRWTAPDFDWGYAFFATKKAEPFAPEVSKVISSLCSAGAIERSGGLLHLSATGEKLRNQLSHHVTAKDRAPYLDAAVAIISLIPIPLVLRALGHDPTLISARPSRELLDETALNILASYHDALAKTLGSPTTLLSLAELWIRYLLAISEAEAA